MLAAAEAGELSLRDAIDSCEPPEVFKAPRIDHVLSLTCLALRLGKSKAGSRAMLVTGMFSAQLRAARYAWPASEERRRGSEFDSAVHATTFNILEAATPTEIRRLLDQGLLETFAMVSSRKCAGCPCQAHPLCSPAMLEALNTPRPSNRTSA